MNYMFISARRHGFIIDVTIIIIIRQRYDTFIIIIIVVIRIFSPKLSGYFYRDETHNNNLLRLLKDKASQP